MTSKAVSKVETLHISRGYRKYLGEYWPHPVRLAVSHSRPFRYEYVSVRLLHLLTVVQLQPQPQQRIRSADLRIRVTHCYPTRN